MQLDAVNAAGGDLPAAVERAEEGSVLLKVNTRLKPGQVRDEKWFSTAHSDLVSTRCQQGRSATGAPA